MQPWCRSSIYTTYLSIWSLELSCDLYTSIHPCAYSIIVISNKCVGIGMVKSYNLYQRFANMHWKICFDFCVKVIKIMKHTFNLTWFSYNEDILFQSVYLRSGAGKSVNASSPLFILCWVNFVPSHGHAFCLCFEFSHAVNIHVYGTDLVPKCKFCLTKEALYTQKKPTLGGVLNMFHKLNSS